MVSTVAHVRKAETAAEKRLGRLKDLAQKSGKMIYERARLAAEMLADREWLDEVHEGDEGKAIDWLAGEYFADISIQLEAMVGIFRSFPEAVWAEHRFSLNRLLIAWRESNRTQPTGQTRPRPSTKDFEEKVEEVKHLEAKVERKDKELERVAQEAAAVRNRLHELEIENAELRGRIAQLEKLAAAR